VKTCVTCRWHVVGELDKQHYCVHPTTLDECGDPVTGSTTDSTLCKNERQPFGACKREGRRWAQAEVKP